MFETFVLICVIGNSNVCHTLSDLEGPYETKQECIERAYEIGEELQSYMPNFQALKYKCSEEIKGTRTNYDGRSKGYNEGSHDKWWSQT